MTTTAEKIAIMQAFVDGKAVEYKLKNGTIWNIVLSANPIWEWEHIDYRIKPQWEPKIGEAILVSNDNYTWDIRIFIRKQDEEYITADFMDCNDVLQTRAWEQCKPVPTSFLAFLESVI